MDSYNLPCYVAYKPGSKTSLAIVLRMYISHDVKLHTNPTSGSVLHQTRPVNDLLRATNISLLFSSSLPLER